MCEVCTLVTLVLCLADVAVIAGDAGDTEQARLLVEEVGKLCRSEVLFLCDERDNRRIKRAGTGTHHEAVKRGETHAGVDDLAVLDGGDGGTVADVAGDKLQILDVLAHELCNAVADIAVGGAVEAIAADLVLLIVLIRHSEHVSLLRHGGMESRIEHDNFRDFLAENVHAGANALYMCAVVQRCKRDEAFDALDDLFVNENGLAEERAALNDTVADSSDFAQILNDADFAVEKCVLDLLERFGVVRHADFDLLLSAVCRLVAENAHFKANLLAVALCKHLLVVHIDQLILK